MKNTKPQQAVAAPTIEQIFQQAVTCHHAGQLHEAECLYHIVLQTQSDHTDAKHNLCILKDQLEQTITGLPHFKAALEADPGQGQHWLNYIDALILTGQMDDARQILQKGRQHGLEGEMVDVLSERLENNCQHLSTETSITAKSHKPSSHKAPLPDQIDALINLFNTGRHAEAIVAAQQMTQSFPHNDFGWKALGTLYKQIGQTVDALQPLQRAVELSPNDAETLNNLSITYQELKQVDKAEKCCRQALQINPNLVEALNTLGIILNDQCRYDEAEASYRQALQIKPDDVSALNNLSNTLDDLGRLDEAEKCCRQALEIDTNYAPAYLTLSNFLQAAGRLDETENSLRRALAIRPEFFVAHNNLGNTLQDLGRLDEAESCFRHSLAIKPDYELALRNLLFTSNYHPDKTSEEIFKTYQEYDDKFGKPLQKEWRAHDNDRTIDRRLKIGYVSPDFKKHSVQYFLEPLLAHHNMQAVDVYAYAELTQEDSVTARLKSYVDHWIPTRDLSDSALTDRIRADGIDILVDLAGHAGKSRLSVFARKPAPVSLSWLGYGYTTGLKAIDYFLTDITTVPQGSEAFFSETPCRIATPCFSYRPNENMGEVSALPASSNGYITLGTLTRAVRINHRTIRVWSSILNQIKNARLVIDSKDFREKAMQERLAEKFAAYGIESERLAIGYHSPPWDVLRSIDIGLDCFPHNSGATLFETLYMGIPFVTLAGRPSVGRLGSCILQGMGHPEWIANSEDEYVDKVVALANDTNRLSQIRATLRKQMEDSPLRDEAGFALKVEAAYRSLWENWCEKRNDIPSSQHTETLMQWFNQGQYADVVPLAQQMTKNFPEHGFSWKILGVALKLMGETNEALPPMQQAVKWLPNDVEAFNNLGNLLQELGQLNEAEANYRQLLAIKPDDAPTYLVLGNILEELGRVNEAETCCLNALKINPDYVPAYLSLGYIFQEQGRFSEAETNYRQVLALSPDYAEAYNNLGNTLKMLGRLDEAEIHLRQALKIKPDYVEALNNLGVTLKDLGQLDEAETCYRRVLQIKPDYELALSSLLFTLNYHPDKSSKDIFKVYQEYDARFGQPHQQEWQAHNNNRNTERRLKIAYVSPDLKRHSVQYFLEPLLAHHDKNAVEVYAYAELTVEDSVTTRYKSYVDQWIPTRGMSDAALAERIRADGIDILIDLAGHTAKNRLHVFARKPAPVSVTWLGFGYTSGLTAIDYFLTDITTVPQKCESFFAETPYRLATPSFSYRPAEGMGAVNALPALTNDTITFGTLTRPERINHRTIQVWSEILKCVENSRLVIDSKAYRENYMQERLAEKFAAHGITRDRLEIGYHTPPWDVLRSIDIGLDCFPHNSGATLFETLYMGIPYVTLAGRPSVGRLGSCILQGIGHPEWIATSEDEYITKVVELASDVSRLSDIRATLRNQMECSPLRDEAGFASKVEAAYRSMWKTWCEKMK